MNALLMLVTILTLPYAGEMGWTNDTTKTCLYKLPATSRLYFVTVPRDQPCPKQVEIRIDDDPKSTDEARQARYAF